MTTAIDPIANLTGGTVTEAQEKTWFTNMRAYLVGLLGSDGAPATARGALGIGDPPFKNRIINGAWRFDQVNEGTAYTVAAATVQAMDGWSGTATGAGTFTMQRVADPDNASLYACKIACTVADVAIGAADNYIVFTTVEGYDAADLKIGTASASSVTLSFDMNFTITGTYGIWLQNSAGNRYYVGTVLQNSASTTESKTLTVALDQSGTWLYTNGIGLKMGIVLAAGSNFQGTAGAWGGSLIETTSAQANFMSANTNVGYIKRIQLEKGPTATPFEETSVQADLARVLRYYRKTMPQGTPAAQSQGQSNSLFICDIAGGGFGTSFPWKFDQEMRGAPAVTLFNPSAANALARNVTIGLDTGAASGTGYTTSIVFTISGANTGTAGHSLSIHASANARLS